MKKIDVSSMIGAVIREVRTVQRDSREAHVVVATRVYDTDLDDAWDAVTNAERISRWFTPIEGELKLGGKYQLKGNASGTITACEPPRHFAATWEYGGGMSWIEVRLEAVGPERTRLVLEHTAHPDDHWKQFGPGAGGVGWDLGLLGLALHLDGGGGNPEEGMAWLMSDEGKQYSRQSSDDWCRAAIAAGTDEAEARAAAERTVAAYTGGA